MRASDWSIVGMRVSDWSIVGIRASDWSIDGLPQNSDSPKPKINLPLLKLDFHGLGLLDSGFVNNST